MNNPKDPKNLPPDDFSKTTPFIRQPREESSSASNAPKDDYTSDWEKTNFNFSPPPMRSSTHEEDWGKTEVNINLPRSNSGSGSQQDDFGKTYMPGQMPPQQSPPSSGWDMTQANINLGGSSSGGHEDFGSAAKQSDFGATTPYLRLPDSERAKYVAAQAPTATPLPEEKPEEKKKAAPAWVWFIGVAGLFFLMAATILGAYWMFSKKYGYAVLVKGAQPQSEIFVDGTRWGYTSGTGDILVSNLTAGQHKIEIRHQNFTYEPESVNGEDGGKTVEVI
ncbi:MAG TPA: hypothetical protein VEQ34_03735, partial [Pyrinomonadaceae bacterium]|nr:hypothetical protein [Pyrinomonadaceae bacterium]